MITTRRFLCQNYDNYLYILNTSRYKPIVLAQSNTSYDKNAILVWTMFL